jgi:hypothetical protein
MEANIDSILRRVGSAMTHYHDEVTLRSYIATLETRILDAEAKWHAEWQRAQSLESRLDALRVTVTGPGKAAYIVFIPDEGDDHETDK